MGSLIIMEIYYSVWVRQVAPEYVTGWLSSCLNLGQLRVKKSFFLSGVNGQMDSHCVNHKAQGPKCLYRWRKMRSRAGGAHLLRLWGLPPACTASVRMHALQEADQAPGVEGRRALAWPQVLPGPWPPPEVEMTRKLEQNSLWKKLEQRLLSECQGQSNPASKYHRKTWPCVQMDTSHVSILCCLHIILSLGDNS